MFALTLVLQPCRTAGCRSTSLGLHGSIPCRSCGHAANVPSAPRRRVRSARGHEGLTEPRVVTGRQGRPRRSRGTGAGRRRGASGETPDAHSPDASTAWAVGLGARQVAGPAGEGRAPRIGPPYARWCLDRRHEERGELRPRRRCTAGRSDRARPCCRSAHDRRGVLARAGAPRSGRATGSPRRRGNHSRKCRTLGARHGLVDEVDARPGRHR